MHIHFLDPYRPQNSPIHRLDPRVKLVLTVAFILTAALTPLGAWPVYILLFALIASVEIVSALGVGYVLKRAALAFPFVLAALPVIFTAPGPVMLSLPLGLTVSQPGLERFFSIALKSWISVQAAIVLAASTPFPELLVAMRAVKLPRLLVAVIGLMWRYIFVLADEALRLIRARAARSSAPPSVALDAPPGVAPGAPPGGRTGGSIVWRARVTGGMAGNLFLRGIERSDRIYMAMVSRGYDGEVRSLPLPGVQPWHWAALAGGLVILALLLAIGFLLGT